MVIISKRCITLLLITFPTVCGRSASGLIGDMRLLGEGGNNTDIDDYVEADLMKDTDDGQGVTDAAASTESLKDNLEGGESPSSLQSPGGETNIITTAAESGSGKVSPAVIKGAQSGWPDDDDDDFVAKKTASAKSNSNITNQGSQEENTKTDKTSQLGVDSDKKETIAKNLDKETADQEENWSGTSEIGGDESETMVSELESSENDQSNVLSLETNEEDTPAQSFGMDLVPDNKENINQSSIEEYTRTQTTISTWDNTDTNNIALPDDSENTINFEPLNQGTPSSEIAYHRNESNQEEDVVADENEGGAQSMHEIAMDEGTNEENPSGLGDSVPAESNVNEEILDSSAQFCRPALNCMECINLSIDHLRSNSDPCYWVGQCVSAGEASSMGNVPVGAYKCGEDGSSISTGEDWDTALNAIAASSQVPIEEKRADAPMNTNYYDYDDDEDGFFENVKFTFNVLLIAAFVASGLLIRKRVMNRLRDDPSLEMVDVVKEELIAFVTSVVNYVKDKVSGSRNNSSISEYSPVTTSNRTESFERQTIPLSTAADEEWGWDDEDTESNVELPAVNADDAKEEEDLALAIAMSLSESANGASGVAQPSEARSVLPKPVAAVKSKDTVPFSARLKEKKSPRAAPKPNATISPAFEQAAPSPPHRPTAAPQGDSIEDLLGQMNAGGGPVITSFGQKPRAVAAKPKPVPKKDSTDDLFASMGFSNSYASKPAAPTAPKSAPLPPSKALAADNLDNDDMDWGDDGDLDDLLDD